MNESEKTIVCMVIFALSHFSQYFYWRKKLKETIDDYNVLVDKYNALLVKNKTGRFAEIMQNHPYIKAIKTELLGEKE